MTNVVEEFLTHAGLEFESTNGDTYVAVVEGMSRKSITLVITYGAQSFTLESFVARNPDENHVEVYRWMLDANRRSGLVQFCTDTFGDIYLKANVPSRFIDLEFLDNVVGSAIELADSSFNPLLALGFRSAIEREWSWRTSNGMDTSNLAAFADFLPSE